ncbi:MAG: hypothetical protein JXA98_09310 [Methanosarcinaceae archaeon]|nr:hypothetical protein [Methanosarcinaceae archaeon]
MKTNNKNIISLAITLQAFILLLAVITIPATAIDDPVVPQLPIILYGNVEINGQPAPVGTVITAELNNEIIACTGVDCEGICGNCPANRLCIGCDADALDNLKFYVGGAEAEVDMDVIKNANPGDVKELYFIATTADSGSSGGTSGGSSGGSGGTSYTSSTSTTSDDGQEDEAIPGATSEKTSSRTTLESTRTDQPSESAEQIPAPEEGSSTTTIGLIAVGGIVLVGAILAFKYGLKGS